MQNFITIKYSEVTMSNNKQSSVEMIEEFLLSHCNPTICNVEWSDFKLMLEQAKAMHKEEIRKAYCYGEHYKDTKLTTDYYNENYGGNNE